MYTFKFGRTNKGGNSNELANNRERKQKRDREETLRLPDRQDIDSLAKSLRFRLLKSTTILTDTIFNGLQGTVIDIVESHILNESAGKKDTQNREFLHKLHSRLGRQEQDENGKGALNAEYAGASG